MQRNGITQRNQEERKDLSRNAGLTLLSSGCEVPVNAKLEDLKAFINFLK